MTAQPTNYNKPFDVVIVGAGAAGCVAALSLPPGARALVVDRSRPGSHRCCGGLLTADACRRLSELGLSVPPAARIQPQPNMVHTHDLDGGREQSYGREYLNVDRRLFDEWLLGLASEKAVIEREAAFLGRADGQLLLRIAGVVRRIHADFVIGADGANSTVRRECFPQHAAPRKMLAIQACLECSAPMANHEVLFASSLTDFYAWAIPKPGCVLIGSAFSDRTRARERFEDILSWYRRAFPLGREMAPRSARYLSQPWRRDELVAGERGVFLAGEAAGLVSPSSGEGISYALSSGAAASAAIGSSSPETTYSKHFDALARAVLRKRLKARVIYSPRLRAMAMRLPWCP